MPICKDCVADGVTTERKIATRPDGSPQPGPRCVTHHRAVKRKRRDRAHELHIGANFGITAEDYQTIYASQGGKCFICQFATGARKRLAVDHEHNKPGCEHNPKQGCPQCVRALLCGPCNQTIGRYGVEALMRAIQVLTNPPARKVLA